MPIAVIVNSHAGSAQAGPNTETLRDRCRAQLNVEIIFVKSGAELVKATRAVIAAGASTIVAGGGDGTISTVAAELIDTSCVLGVLPLGTLNHFAKDLHIPLVLEEALAVIAAGHVAEVDTGDVNGRLFLNNSSLGLYPDMVRSRQQQQRRLGRGKWPAFVTASMMAIRRYPFLMVQLETSESTQLIKTPFIFVGNNAYSMSGFKPGARTTLQDGKLSLYVAQYASRFGLVGLALQALAGRLGQAKDMTARQVHDLTVETHRRRLPVATDGEVTWMQTPLRYRIRPLSLRVLTPASQIEHTI